MTGERSVFDDRMFDDRMFDDRIAALIGEIEGGPADTPERRRSIASSVAIMRAVDGNVTDVGYRTLIGLSNTWCRGHTPEESAELLLTGSPWSVGRAAELAERVADHLGATTADLRDDGVTAALWRRYAQWLRRRANPT